MDLKDFGLVSMMVVGGLSKRKKSKKEKRKGLEVDGVRLVIPGFGSDTKLRQRKFNVQNIPLILENIGIKELLNSR